MRRGTNTFLKKQLDTCSLSLKIAQEEHSKQLQIIQTRNANSSSISNNNKHGGNSASSGGGGGVGNNNTSTPVHHNHGDEVPSPLLFEEMADSLQREQEHTAMLRQQILDLQFERHSAAPPPPTSGSGSGMPSTKR